MRRAHLVLASARGLSPQPMAQRVGCGVQTVRHVIHALNTTGLAGMSKPSTRPKRVEATLNATNAARLQHLQHQSPRTYGKPTGVWTLALAAQVCHAQGVTARCMRDATLRRALHRLQTNGQRAKHWITSPAPDYARKKSGALV
jgi:transposase